MNSIKDLGSKIVYNVKNARMIEIYSNCENVEENIKNKSLLLKNKVIYVCKICKCDDTRVLVVHHLDKNHKNNNIDNLVFLCHNCHHLVHHHKVKIK